MGFNRSLLERNGILSSEDALYAIPGEGALSEEAAIQIAKEIIAKGYRASAEFLEGFVVSTVFHMPDWEINSLAAGKLVWDIYPTLMDRPGING